MTRGRVMVVDDDIDIRESMVDLLVQEGYDVAAAEHGAEAIELLHAGARPDVILLDLMMPVMNGYEFRDEQRKHVEHALIPVVVVSADARATTRATTLDPVAVMQKPVNIVKLLGLVDDLIARRA